MNPILAQIYGTGGIDKVAAEADEDTTFDLNDITGAQLIAGLEDGSIVFNGEEEEAEKTAGDEDEIDLSQYTGQELLDMLDEVQDDGSEVLDKMASDGSAEYWDMAGRIMAHAYADEMNKVASEDEWPEYIDPEQIDGELMVNLLEDGHYELVQEESMDKEAGVKTWLKSTGTKAKEMFGRGKQKTKEVASEVGEKAKEVGRKAKETGGKAGEKAKETGGKAKARGGELWGSYKSTMKGEKGRGRQAAAIGGTGTAALLAGLGGKKGYDKATGK